MLIEVIKGIDIVDRSHHIDVDIGKEIGKIWRQLLHGSDVIQVHGDADPLIGLLFGCLFSYR